MATHTGPMKLELSRPVVVVSTEHGPGFGAEAVLENLLSAWNLRRPLVLVAPADARVLEVASAARIPAVVLPTPRDALQHNLPAIWKLRHSLAGASLVHAWHPRGFELAVSLARYQRCPATGTLHDHPRAYYHGRLRRLLIRWAANRFASVVAVSEATARVGKACGLAGPFRVILNGIVDQPLPPEPHPKRVGFLGMNAVAKGFPVIREWIEATADGDWEWYLYGHVAAELAAPAKHLAQRFPNRVHLRGRVDTLTIFNEIGLLAHASTAFEALGMVLVEAGRAGIPVVAGDMGGTREVVVEGENGFLFRPDSPAHGLAQLRRLMGDGDLRRTMGLAGRRRFETQFQAERMARDYAAFWAEIGSGVSGRRR